MVFSCVWGIQISSREVFACLGMYHEENALFMILNDILFFFNVFFMDLMYLNGGARMSQEVRPQYTPFILGFIIYNPLIRSPLIHPLPGRDIHVRRDPRSHFKARPQLQHGYPSLWWHCSLQDGESISSWWQLKDFWNFHPRISGEDAQFDSYFSKGLKPPTRCCWEYPWRQKIRIHSDLFWDSPALCGATKRPWIPQSEKNVSLLN